MLDDVASMARNRAHLKCGGAISQLLCFRSLLLLRSSCSDFNSDGRIIERGRLRLSSNGFPVIREEERE